MFAVLGAITLIAHIYNLNNIKSKTVGDGQHGTARWANKAEIRKTYRHIPFTPKKWRRQAKQNQTPTMTATAPRKLLRKKAEPTEEALPQGIVVGCKGGKHSTTAMIDTGDVHVLMIGAAGVGKTAFWLYPCIEYACASGMSFLSTDTKGDVMRNYGNIAKDYGYMVSVIDLRNPTRSNGNNILYLVNKYTDLYAANPDQIVYKAKAEKYAKIISKTIILSGMDAASFGQNAYFYDAAEGLLTATILLVAEFCAPEKRHIVSVFKVIQELLAPSKKKGKNQFQQLMELLPNEHKAKWFAGAALNTAEQSMASVMSTALSRLNAFLDTELEQLLCFDTEIDAETFCNQKSAIFVIMPEENPNTFFMISLIIQQLYREILAVADENGGKLKNRCVFFCDEFGFASRLESVMEFASEAGNFLDHLLLLIDLDRVDPAVLSGIIRLLDRFTETGVQKPYLRIQNISEAEKNRHIHAAFLNAVHNFHETDRRSLRTESRHNEFSLVIDVKVSGAPVLDSVKIRGIAGCPMFESVFMNVHSRVVPPTFKSLPDCR